MSEARTLFSTFGNIYRSCPASAGVEEVKKHSLVHIDVEENSNSGQKEIEQDRMMLKMYENLF